MCREQDTELLAQDKSGKRKSWRTALFVCVCVRVAILVFTSWSRCCGIDRRSFVEMFPVSWECFQRRRQGLCGKMNLVVLLLLTGDERLDGIIVLG